MGIDSISNPTPVDHEIVRRIGGLPLPMEVPTNRLPVEDMYHGSRLAPKGVTHIHHFFLPRAAHALAAMWHRADAHAEPRIRRMLLYFVEQAIWGMSVLGSVRPNTLFPSQSASERRLLRPFPALRMQSLVCIGRKIEKARENVTTQVPLLMWR